MRTPEVQGLKATELEMKLGFELRYLWLHEVQALIHFTQCHCLAAGLSCKLEWRHREQARKAPFPPVGGISQEGWDPLT